MAFIDQLPTIWRFDHKKGYLQVFDKVVALDESAKKTLETSIPTCLENIKNSMDRINKKLWIYTVTALGLLALNFKDVNFPLSMTFISLSLIFAIILVCSGIKLFILRKSFIYSRLINDVFSDISAGKNRNDMKEIFETLEDLMKIMK